MTHSAYLLAAAWLVSAGEPAPLPAGPVQPVYSVPADATPMPVYSYPVQESQPGFFGRLKSKLGGLFNKKSSTCPCQHQQQQQQLYYPAPVPVLNSEPPLAEQISLKQLVPSQGYIVPVNPEGSSEELSETPAQDGQPISKKFVSKVGHEEDYSWVTGQLSLAHTSEGDFWVVHYATLDMEDKYGGSIVLAPAVSMRNYREGDLVSVKGEVIDEGRANKHLGGALYRVQSIDMIDRAD